MIKRSEDKVLAKENVHEQDEILSRSLIFYKDEAKIRLEFFNNIPSIKILTFDNKLGLPDMDRLKENPMILYIYGYAMFARYYVMRRNAEDPEIIKDLNLRMAMIILNINILIGEDGHNLTADVLAALNKRYSGK